MGRPTELTPDVQKKVVDAVRAGLRFKEAYTYAGISERLFYLWKARGEGEPGSVYGDFFQALKEAEAEAELDSIVQIRKAAHGNKENKPQWQAAAWLLERRYPERHGRKLELSGNEHKPLVVLGTMHKVLQNKQGAGYLSGVNRLAQVAGANGNGTNHEPDTNGSNGNGTTEHIDEGDNGGYPEEHDNDS